MFLAATPSGLSNNALTPHRSGKFRLKVMGDSGAADCVLPSKMFPGIDIDKSSPKLGTKYTAANGEPIYNEGQKTLVGSTGEGYRRKLNFQVCDVNRPLASFRRIAEQGHRIVLDNDAKGGAGYMEHKVTGERTELFIENGVYMFDFWVDLPASAVFRGQGSQR